MGIMQVPQTPQSVPVQAHPAPYAHSALVQPTPAQPVSYPQPGSHGQQAPLPQPPAPVALGPGARVHVTWADGNRYPATVQQVAGSQYLVLFNDGGQRWVDARFISIGA
jgi:hypothetical protein